MRTTVLQRVVFINFGAVRQLPTRHFTPELEQRFLTVSEKDLPEDMLQWFVVVCMRVNKTNLTFDVIC